MYFIIYDFETTGLSVRFDQILQAGFICYNKNLQEISRLNIKAKINPDIVPSIQGLVVNKLLISTLLNENNSSYSMVNSIVNYLDKYRPATFLGYNSLHFDEEVLRQTLWEHFKYPYITSSQRNLRGDLMELVRMVHKLNPNSINVDKNEEGNFSYKLDSLSTMNNFHIQDAHEAISDIIATKKVLEIIKNNSHKLYENFLENLNVSHLTKKIKNTDFFTMHAYYYGKHYIYLLSHLVDHPIYNDTLLAFDLKFDPNELIELSFEELSEMYFTKKLKCFRKIKLKKQPGISNFEYALNCSPYNEYEIAVLKKRKNTLLNSDLKDNLSRILLKEAENYEENKSQETPFEEQTIYSQSLNFNDRSIMNQFDLVKWEEKWNFSQKFRDPRLRFFAAKHIFRNFPEFLPKKVFKHFHQKVSERLNSMKDEKFTTIADAKVEADNLSLEFEDIETSDFLKKQLEQYNIYINFLDQYYNDCNAKPKKFDEVLSKTLFS